MCDYSLQAVKTRPAKIDDKLTVRLFGCSTRGFAASEDRSVAVCLLPGTKLSFAEEVRQEFSARSINKIRRLITTPSNSLMVGSSWRPFWKGVSKRRCCNCR
jgi:hypothetical protein